MNRTLNLFAAAALALGLALPAAFAQSTDSKPADSTLKTYFLATAQQNEAQEIVIALRTIAAQGVRIDLVNSKNAIVVSAPPEEQAKVQKIIGDLDHPQKTYRLTFTIADSDNGKRVGIQHISMVVAAGQRTMLKQGDKIPVATGSYGKGSDPVQTQFQYLDVGMNLDATLQDTPNGLQLKSKIEQSSLGEPSTIAGVQEPVIRQSVIEGTSKLSAGKPTTLGSVDVTGTTRHIDIEVVAEPIS